MWIQLSLSVTVLILIQNFVLVDATPPSAPLNVSIHCDNYGVEAQVDYPYPRHELHFRVKVTANYPTEYRIFTFTTQNVSINISSYLHYSEYNYYFVSVEAVRGAEKSNASRSPIFSFNEDNSQAVILCRLDFPEVQLSGKDGKLHVQFTNPVHQYRNSPALSDVRSYLTYTVQSDESYKKSKCEMEVKICETSMNFSEHRGNYCVNVSGEIGQRYLNPTRACFTGDIRIYPPITVYLYPLLGIFATVLVFTVIILLLAKKINKNLKKAIPPLPGPLVLPPSSDLDSDARKLPVLVPDLEICNRAPEILPPEKHTDQTPDQTSNQTSDETPLLEDKSASKHLEIWPSDKSSFSDKPEEEPDELLGEGYDMGHGLRVEMIPGEFLDAYGHE